MSHHRTAAASLAVLARLAVAVAVTLLAGTPALAGVAGTDLFLPMVGRQAGVYPSNWYTTVWIHNPGAQDATARVHFLERNTANYSPPAIDVVVAAGATERIENVVESLFLLRGFGALRVTCDTERLVVTSRVFTRATDEGEAESLGQDFAAVPAAFAIGLGERGQILGGHQTVPAGESQFRLNFGFVETTGRTATVRVTVYDENGMYRAAKDFQVRESSQRQVAFKDHFPDLAGENLRLEVEVVAGAGKVIAYGSLIANGSQDPTTFEMTYADDLLGTPGGDGLAVVAHDATLVGDGTPGSPLALADGAVTLAKIAATGAPSPAPAGDVAALAAAATRVLATDGATLTWQETGAGITGVSAGEGLSGGGSAGEVTLAVAEGGIVSGMIADGAVTAAGLAQDAVTNDKIAASAVGHDELADWAVVTAKLGPAVVTREKLAGGAVGPAELADGAVLSSHLSDFAVTTAALGNGAVTREKLAAWGGLAGQVLATDGSVLHWQDPGGDVTGVSAGEGLSGGGDAGEVTLAVAAGGITGAMIADGAVGGADLADFAVNWQKLAADAVGGEHIVDGAVSKAKLSATGGASGQVLGTDGTALVWQDAGGLSLPFSDSVASTDSAFLVTNTAAGPGLQGISNLSGAGVLGRSGSGSGVAGLSTSGTGVQGVSGTGPGVTGLGGTSSGLAVLGAPGVYGDASGSVGVYGTSHSAAGVYGMSIDNVGAAGVSANDTGVHGITTGGSYGVKGEGGSMYGVFGVTASGIAGVSGVNTKNWNTGGLGHEWAGVYGEHGASRNSGSLGTARCGVSGLLATSGITNDSGVCGESMFGVTNGVYGRTTSPADAATGVFGVHDYSVGRGVGVWGRTTSINGVGGKLENTGGGHALVARTTSTYAGGDVIQGIGYGGSNLVFKVDTFGDVWADGSFHAGGADLAEHVDATDALTAGDVVEIDPGAPGRFRLAQSALSTLVAGVVSTRPGLALNHDGSDDGGGDNDRPLLALAGRVPVKVTGEGGPIAVGDLLVASSTPGRAMRCADRHACAGAVIGKALEPGGDGTIVMLVTLQ